MKPWIQWNVKQNVPILLVLAAIHILLAVFGRSLPESLYYRHDIGRLKRLESLRVRDSAKALRDLRDFMSSSGINGPLFAKESAKHICVDILSVVRPEGYLTQTVAALLTRIPFHLQDKVRITLHNFSSPSSKNTEATDLGDLIVVKNAEYREGMHPGKYGENACFIKENIDYMVAMDSVLKNGCEYGLLLEDDAVASAKWAEDLITTLEVLSKDSRPWIVLKLFSSFAWITWNVLIPSDVLLVTGLTLLITAGVVCLMYCVFAAYSVLIGHVQYKLIESEKSYLRPNFWTIFLLLAGVASFIVLFGKYNIFQYSSGVHDLDIGASCVANIYPRKELKVFRNYLNSEFLKYESMGILDLLPKKDLHFREFIDLQEKKNGWRYRQLFRLPNLFQHIGRKTSLDKDSSWETMVVSHYFKDDKLPIRFRKDYSLS